MLYTHQFKECIFENMKKSIFSALLFAAITSGVTNLCLADDVLMVADEGAKITARDIKVELSSWPKDKREKSLATDSAKENLAKELLSRRLLSERMAKSGVLESPDLQLRLKLAQERLLYEIYMEREEAKALENADLKALAFEKYKAESEKYRRTVLKASHILIRPNGGCGVDAESFAGELRKRIIEGESFEELAKKYSDDPSSKDKGGSLGVVFKGKTVPAFDNAVFLLKNKGDISEVIKSGFGFHVIRLDEVQKVEVVPFEEVRQQLEDSILMSIRQSVRLPIFEQLRDSSAIRVDSDALKKAFENL